ncbi:unnamed protein product [Cercopithifilaria johnstoni]|uniref:RNase NYN domain-containing protein n=1 Tax=Cercopithifilaria johnstoni TaxID=2874296 RepID=A0A8J2LYZ0_9BILA|nr:unnamed protein product [Cercopithifilaria johnstoni]
MYPFDRIRERIYARPSESAIPRLIVIDGCNVARSSCGIDRLDVLTFTPARTARAGRPAFINYDDLYVLEFAERHGGCVLSGDKFDDIAKEHSYKNLRRIIKERRIHVIFRPLTSDFVYYGRDRFFRFLPELSIIHDNNDSWPIEEHIQQRLYCLPNDKDYVKVASCRQRWTVERRDEIICTIDSLFDEIATKNCLVPKIIPMQTSNAKELTNNIVSVKCASDCKELNLIHPEELTKRWLSPTASCPTAAKREEATQEKSKMVSRNDVTLSMTSTKQSTSIAYDVRCAKIISRLDQIFDRALIVKVLTENKIRDLHTIANLCAQQTL